MCDLLERIKAAIGPSWELDRDIGLALGGWSYVPADHEVAQQFPSQRWLEDSDGNIFADSSSSVYDWAYTESLDAAHALRERLLPGWTYSVDATAPLLGISVTLYAPAPLGGCATGDHKSECLALLAALVAAEMEENPNV